MRSVISYRVLFAALCLTVATPAVRQRPKGRRPGWSSK